MNSTKSKTESISFRRSVAVSWRMLNSAWQIRPWAVGSFFIGAALEIGGFIISIYATARLGGLLAAFITTSETTGIWFWLWIDIAASILIGMGFFVMSYAKRLLYFDFIRWSINTF